MQIRRKNRAEVTYTLKRICVGMTKTMLLLVELFPHCASKPIKTTRTGGNSNFFVRFWKQTLLHDSSLRANSPIWVSEASLARTRERAAKLAQIGELARRLALFRRRLPCTRITPNGFIHTENMHRTSLNMKKCYHQITVSSQLSFTLRDHKL